MAAIYSNLQSGTITDAPLVIGGTTVNSAGFATLPVVAGPNFMWMTLDPTGVAGTPEIVKVTAHTSAATACTIVRGQQTSQGGGAAREHLVSTKWACGVTANDLDDLPHRLLTAKAGLISASAAATPSVLAPGSDYQVLAAKTAETTGLKWVDGVTTKGDLQTFTTVPARLAVGSDHGIVVADSGAASGLRYAAGLTTKGDLLGFSTAEARLGVGTNGQTLESASGAATGLQWGTKGVWICTSGTRPAHSAGLVIFETDTTATLQSTGAAWVELSRLTGPTGTYVPVITQGASVFTKTITTAEYDVQGHMVDVRLNLALLSNGSSAVVTTVSLPPGFNNANGGHLGSGYYYVITGGFNRNVECLAQSATEFIMVIDAATGAAGYGQAPANIGAAGDVIRVTLRYRWA